MILKVNNEADKHALAQVASLQNPRSLQAIIAEYILAFAVEGEDVTVHIHRDLLPDSYKRNPSLFGIHMLSKCEGFEDSSGHATAQRSTHVTIKILRQRKPDNMRYAQSKPSIKRTIKNWLNLNDKRSKRLKIPIAGIPPFYFSHAEQLRYQIKQETQTPIKIIRLKKNWIIARK